MYNNKIKTELFKKIALLKKVEAELEKKHEEYTKIYGDDPDYDELEKNDKELYDLFDRQISLENDEIPELLLETKFYPLCGLAPHQMELLKHYGHNTPDFWQDLEDIKTGEKKDVLICESAIEKHLELHLEKNREDMKRRIGLLKPLKLSIELKPWIRHLYKQTTLCFVQGFFESCCILTRANAELIVKNYIELKGCGHLLVGKDKMHKTASLPEILRYIKVERSIISLYIKTTLKGNLVLHTMDKSISEEDALSSIETLRSFISKFPTK